MRLQLASSRTPPKPFSDSRNPERLAGAGFVPHLNRERTFSDQRSPERLAGASLVRPQVTSQPFGVVERQNVAPWLFIPPACGEQTPFACDCPAPDTRANANKQGGRGFATPPLLSSRLSASGPLANRTLLPARDIIRISGGVLAEIAGSSAGIGASSSEAAAPSELVPNADITRSRCSLARTSSPPCSRTEETGSS